MPRATPVEVAYPADAAFNKLIGEWWRTLGARIVGLVWEAYDLAMEEVLNRVDWSKPMEDIEREVTSLIEPRISRRMTGFEPFHCQHGSYEIETRLPAPAQPPAYDIAFVFNRNERLKWPIEAKVLKTSAAVGAYVDDLRRNFLTGRYGPFSGEGAMLGYLCSGRPGDALQNIALTVPCKIAPHPDFPERTHGLSTHQRKLPPGSNWVRDFSCHHLIMPLRGESD